MITRKPGFTPFYAAKRIGLLGFVCLYNASVQAQEVFSLEGHFFSPTSEEEVKTWNFPVSNDLVFEKIVVEMDVTPGDWWQKNLDGLHNLFWLTREGTWRHNTVGYVNLFGEGRYQLKQMTNLELPRGEAKNALTQYRPRKGKSFRLTYTYDGKAGEISTVITESGVLKAAVHMATTTDLIQTKGGFYQLWIGLEEKYNECPTYGWKYANLRIRMEPASKPLTVHKKNPRYFDNGSGKAVVLCGVNHGWELQDNGWSTPYTLDWDGFLDYLERYNLNYIRLWKTESTIGRENTDTLTNPMPYVRVGSELANDGHPTFDLDQFNQAYFDRMRQRCLDARRRGMYVCIMFFEKHSTFNQRSDAGREYPWKAHPFHPSNNINDIDPDINGDGTPIEIHHLPAEQPDRTKKVLAQKTLDYQKAYIRKVVNTVNDLDNVIFEVCNEALPDGATDRWQIHLAQYFKDYESTKPVRHLVGFTGPAKYHVEDPWPDLEEQKVEIIDFVSPREVDLYRNNPPVNDGEKIVFADSDHIYPYGRDNIWVWKSFLRGLHPQSLEAYGIIPENPPRIDYERDRLVRLALGKCLSYSVRMDLASMEPRPDLTSTGYCLAHPGKEYLVFAPDGSAFNLDLQEEQHAFSLEWYSIDEDKNYPGEVPSHRQFKAPFKGPAVAYLQKD